MLSNEKKILYNRYLQYFRIIYTMPKNNEWPDRVKRLEKGGIGHTGQRPLKGQNQFLELPYVMLGSWKSFFCFGWKAWGFEIEFLMSRHYSLFLQAQNVRLIHHYDKCKNKSASEKNIPFFSYQNWTISKNQTC